MVDPSTLQKSSRNHSNQSSPGNYPPALEERFATNEGHIGIKGPVPKNVYQRLKRIEERILYLESLSPEYRNFWVRLLSDNQNYPSPNRIWYHRYCDIIIVFQGGQEDESNQSSYKAVRKRVSVIFYNINRWKNHRITCL